jgi:hypothetical protein
MRLLYTILFGVVFWILCWILTVTAIAQSLLWLFSSAPSERLVQFGRGLAAYTRQVVLYLCYCTDSLPFPFSDWPNVPTQISADDLKNL